MPKESLVCEECQSSWRREQTRGRKPRLCPNCLSAPQTASKAPRIVIEDQSLRKPTIKVLDTNIKTPVKYKGKNSWFCPDCKSTFQTFVGLMDEPMHWCKKNTRNYIPFQLSRQDAQA